MEFQAFKRAKIVLNKATNKLKTNKTLQIQVNKNSKNNQVNQKSEILRDEDQTIVRQVGSRDIVNPRQSYNFVTQIICKLNER
jgi:hypothetical protein